MPTPNFDQNILAASRRLQDLRTDPSPAGDPGHRYTSALLTYYQNAAVRDLLTETLKAKGDDIGSIFPEYMKSAQQALTSNSFATPTDLWLLTQMTIPATGVNVYPIKQDEVLFVTQGLNPLIQLTANNPGFYQEGQSVILYPAATYPQTNSVQLRYFINYVDIVQGSDADLAINRVWWTEVVNRMVKLAVADAKPVVA